MVSLAGGHILSRVAHLPRHGLNAALHQSQMSFSEVATTSAASTDTVASSSTQRRTGSEALFYSGAVLMSLLGFSVSVFSLSQLQGRNAGTSLKTEPIMTVQDVD